MVGLPVHHKDSLLGTHMAFRMTMAIEAPFHRQRLLFPCQRHQINPPVARNARNSLLNVNSMLKIDEVGKVVNTGPDKGLTVPQTGTHRLEHRTVSPDLRVAGHASMRGRHTRKCCVLNRGMAIATVYP